MRFLITLEADLQKGNSLPLNYQYELSSWIYRTLGYGSPEFSEFLHNSGYMNKEKKFKLFCFSLLRPDKFRVNGDRMMLSEPLIRFNISFIPIEAMEPFIQGLFRGIRFTLGDKISRVNMCVQSVERLPDPVFTDKMKYRLISPVHIVMPRPGRFGEVDHLAPEHPEFETLFLLNLAEKHNAYYPPKQYDLSVSGIKVLSKVSSKLVCIKKGTPQETRLKSYLFDFELSAPPELQRVGYFAGFGKENSQGFGCGEIKI